MIQSNTITKELDVYAIRQQFPAAEPAGERSAISIVLDNAVTTQKPQVVIDALVDYYTNYNANVHRGIHTLAEEATAAFEASRDAARAVYKRFFKRRDHHLPGVLPKVLNLVAYTWGRKNIKAGDEIITEMEHHSNIVPWQILCEERGAYVKNDSPAGWHLVAG